MFLFVFCLSYSSLPLVALFHSLSSFFCFFDLEEEGRKRERKEGRKKRKGGKEESKEKGKQGRNKGRNEGKIKKKKRKKGRKEGRKEARKGTNVKIDVTRSHHRGKREVCTSL